MPIPPPPDGFVLPGTWFEWVITTLVGGFGSVFSWIFRQHLRDDDRRFKETNHLIELQEARIAIKHAENIAAMQQVRGDILAGQSNLATQFQAMRRTLDDVLLRDPKPNHK